MTVNDQSQSTKPCWINSVDYDEADSGLKQIYDRVKSPDARLHNLYQAFSLRPHTIVPADDLYLAALHNEGNTLPKRFSELIGTYVAILAGCRYAATHHGHNYRYLAEDPEHAADVLDALADNRLASCGTDAEIAALRYTKKLCECPADINEEDVGQLREAGWDDGEVLEIVQIVAMFSYFVRVINGVGIQLGDERVGLYP